jgi:tripartite-type tricarboxylate transporter receptor subunit TctC
MACATIVAIWIACAAIAGAANALQLVVGGAPGSAPDLAARRIADGLSNALHEPVVVLNRPGAGGAIAMNALVHAKPDGSTVALAHMSQLVFSPYILEDIRYDSMRDLVPVATVLATPMIIVALPTFDVTSFAELVERAKRKPEEIRFATASNASPPRVVLAIVARATGARFDAVPFKSDPEALTNVLSGELPLLITAPSVALPYIRAGRLKPLVVTSHARLAALPDVPTIGESGFPNLEFELWLGIVAPAGTPAAIVSRLYEAIRQVAATPDFVASAQATGNIIVISSPDEFSALIRDAHAHWGAVLRELRTEFR